MNSTTTTKIGGFATDNQGEIFDCYTLTSYRKKNALSASFTYKNSGQIKHCYSSSKKSSTEELVSESTGAIEDSYLISASTNPETNFDETIWEKGSGTAVYQFIENNWKYPINEELLSDKPHIQIHSMDDLYEFAQRVNQGDASAQNAYVTLECDLNLQGKEWIPIGQDFGHTFTGIFDGNCHIIKNYIIKGTDLTFKGFFGVLRGEVYNLTVDSHIKGNGAIGGFAAQNEGIIGCCAAIVSISSKNSEWIGGFTARNKGKIFQSYASGSIHFSKHPLWMILAPIAAVLFTGSVFALTFFFQNQETFKPIPVDVGQEALPEKDDSFDPSLLDDSNAENHVLYSLNQTLELDLKTGTCTINLQNPSVSNKNFVAEIFLKSSSSAKDFSIAKTGALEPGHKIETISIDNATLSKLSAGSYKAVVHLSFYDTGDNSLAMVNLNADVTLEVK